MMLFSAMAVHDKKAFKTIFAINDEWSILSSVIIQKTSKEERFYNELMY